jgi:hypothetical protein
MSNLRAILDRINDVEATIARAEIRAGRDSDLATLLSLKSLEQRREMLREELADVTKEQHVEICDYRIIPENTAAYAISAVSSALHNFQDLVTLIFDSIVSGKPKQRGRVGADVVHKTQFEFGFAYSGSLGIVLTIPNDRLLGDEPSNLDTAVNKVFELVHLNSASAVRHIAHSYGVPTVRKLHDWAKTHYENGMSADIKWVRGKEVRSEILAQPSEMARIYNLIKQKSEKRTERVVFEGNLLAWNVPKRTFTFQAANAEPITGHWADDFEGPAIARKVPRKYRAYLNKEVTVHYGEDREDFRWSLRRLTPTRTKRKSESL